MTTKGDTGEAKVAWLHHANDNYYTDEQFQAENKINSYMERFYIKFIEHSAYLALSKMNARNFELGVTVAKENAAIKAQLEQVEREKLRLATDALEKLK